MLVALFPLDSVGITQGVCEKISLNSRGFSLPALGCIQRASIG